MSGMTGAEALLRALEKEGVDVVFGLPGGANLPIYDALVDANSLRHILVRHEQSAAHMAEMTGAEALIRALEKEGVDVVFGLPGGANLPIYDALVDANSLRHILVRHEQSA